MNHWLLCGRDLMWLVLAILPIASAFLLGQGCTTRSDGPLFAVAVVGQALIIFFLYGGFIK